MDLLKGLLVLVAVVEQTCAAFELLFAILPNFCYYYQCFISTWNQPIGFVHVQNVDSNERVKQLMQIQFMELEYNNLGEIMRKQKNN